MEMRRDLELGEKVRLEEREEAERHDALYSDLDPETLTLSPSDWLKFDAVAEPLNAYYGSILRLRDVQGKQLLDAGCGDGWLSVILAKRGAIVRGFDISSEGVKVAQARAEVNGVGDQCEFVTGSFYDMPYEDQSFDLVIGQAILHHLRNKELAARELHRVMKPGAKAVFVEPFGNSTFFERLRRVVPVESMAPEDPTEWKRQFKYRELKPFTEYFEVDREEFQFFSRIDRVLKNRWLVGLVNRVDRRLLRSIPFLRPFARSIVLEFRRRTV